MQFVYALRQPRINEECDNNEWIKNAGQQEVLKERRGWDFAVPLACLSEDR
jgi:hypothetical protein